MNCERCGKTNSKMVKCNYCEKNLCPSCVKSSKRVDKTKRFVICRSCWGDLGARKKFKAA